MKNRKKGIMLSMKDLVFKKRPVKKLTERYVGPYIVEEVKRKKNLEKVWRVKLNLKTGKFRRSELVEKYTVKLLYK